MNPIHARIVLRIALVALSATLFGSGVRADVLHVEADGSGDYSRIQSAIDAANFGDTVMLGPGTYRDVVQRNLNGDVTRAIAFMKSGVILASSGGPDVTILDAEWIHHGIVGQNLGASTLVRGISIINGSPSGEWPWGGGFLFFYSDVVVEHCYIKGCEAEGGGGLMFLGRDAPTLLRDDDGPTVRSCFFENNYAGDLGGAIEVAVAGGFLIEGNTFVSNGADRAGGAILLNNCLGVVRSNLMSGNWADEEGGAVGCIGGAGPYIAGSCNMFWLNSAPDSPDVKGCFIEIGENGNVIADPLFCDPAAGNFRIPPESPAAPEHSGDCGLIGGLPVGCEGGGAYSDTVTAGNGVAPAGSEVEIPLFLSGAAPVGSASYACDLSFDPAIASFVRLETVGTLSVGRLAVGNEATPGTLRIAVAGTTPITGDGLLLRVVLLVSPGAVDGSHSPVTIDTFSWREGIPAGFLVHGGVTVGEGLFVSGHVTYYSSLAPIAGVALDLTGDLTERATSDGSGAYEFGPLWLGSQLSIVPSFDDLPVGAWSALDASLVLQSLVDLITLDDAQTLAADVTGDTSVSTEDASRILRMVVGDGTTIPDPIWVFLPESVVVDSLLGAINDADFSGIVRGDVSGNWSAGSYLAQRDSQGSTEWIASGAWSGDVFQVDLRFEGSGASGLEAVVEYDGDILQLANLGTSGTGLWETRHSTGGLIVAGATAEPWGAGEAGIRLEFTSRIPLDLDTSIRIPVLRADESPFTSETIRVPGNGMSLSGEGAFDMVIVPNPAFSDVAFALRGPDRPYTIDVLDVTGRRIRSFDSREQRDGSRTVTWDRRDGKGVPVSAGIYFVRLRSGDEVRTKRVVILR